MKNYTLLLASLGLCFSLNAQMLDPSFEAGIDNSPWEQSSVNFGTPICSVAECGDCGGGCVPRTGDWYLWFGGFPDDSAEIGAVAQTFVIPSGTEAILGFYLNIANPGSSSAEDAVVVLIDDNIIDGITADNQDYRGAYTLKEVDISDYADGNEHVLTMVGGHTTATPCSFIVDDFSLKVDGNDATNINELLNHESPLSVYPNPASSLVNLSFGPEINGSTTVQIYDMNGLLVSDAVIAQPSNTVYQKPTDNLANGLYTIRIINQGRTFSERLLISK